MQEFESFIQDIFQINKVNSLQDLHVMLRYKRPFCIGKIHDNSVFMEVRKESNAMMRKETYLVLYSGIDTVCRTNALFKYKSIDLKLKWAHRYFSSFLEYDRIFQEFGYEMQYPMKYIRHGVSIRIEITYIKNTWQTLVIGEDLGTYGFFKGDDLISNIVTLEKRYLTLEELPLLNSRLKELIIRST